MSSKETLQREGFALRAVAIIKEIQQIYADAAQWNRLNPTKEPINPDPSGELEILMRGMKEFLVREAPK